MRIVLEFVFDRYLNKSFDRVRRTVARRTLARLDRTDERFALARLPVLLALILSALVVAKFAPRATWLGLVLFAVAASLLLQMKSRAAVRWLALRMS